jgi:hypothetical protein
VATWISDQITAVGSHYSGYQLENWTDGKTQARIRWTGTDEGDTEVIERVCKTARGTVGLLGDIEVYGNLRLVSAVLEPLTPE